MKAEALVEVATAAELLVRATALDTGRMAAQ